MFGNGIEDFFCSIVKDLHFSCACGITGILLLQHLDHHIVGGFVDEWD